MFNLLPLTWVSVREIKFILIDWFHRHFESAGVMSMIKCAKNFKQKPENVKIVYRIYHRQSAQLPYFEFHEIRMDTWNLCNA